MMMDMHSTSTHAPRAASFFPLVGSMACALLLAFGAAPALAQNAQAAPGSPTPAASAASAPAPAAVPAADGPASATPAALTPQAGRITDQAIRADLVFIGSQIERARRLNDSGIQPFSAYHFAKSVHWLEFAYDEYQVKNRSGVIEQALAEGTKLIALMETREPNLPDDTPLIAGALRVREDLWSTVARFKADKDGFRCAGGDVARMEVQLVWAGYVQKEMGWRSAKPYLQAAERYYRDALAAAETCPRIVAKVDESLAKLPPAKQVEVLADRVHFAYDRANIATSTAPVLDRIASILRANPAISISIEGHADERGSADYNLRLSQRRADAVRAYLAAAGVETARMKTAAFGKSKPEVKGADAETYAVNRRVVIVPSVAADLEIRPQREDLQLEKRRAR
jgi:outer membrane protein OmpA-like peptidoglycan-associated protein